MMIEMTFTYSSLPSSIVESCRVPQHTPSWCRCDSSGQWGWRQRRIGEGLLLHGGEDSEGLTDHGWGDKDGGPADLVGRADAEAERHARRVGDIDPVRVLRLPCDDASTGPGFPHVVPEHPRAQFGQHRVDPCGEGGATHCTGSDCLVSVLTGSPFPMGSKMQEQIQPPRGKSIVATRTGQQSGQVPGFSVSHGTSHTSEMTQIVPTGPDLFHFRSGARPQFLGARRTASPTSKRHLISDTP
jgi:hypothetical protein